MMNKLPVKVGITGSIGMGKTTVALEMSQKEYPIWDSDKVVHNLYKRGNRGYSFLKTIVPEVAKDLNVDRDLLSEILVQKPSLLKLIENTLFPIISKQRNEFLNKNNNKKIVLFDIPLLFETRCDEWLDCVIVVTAPLSVQKKRVLSRTKMTEEKFLYILSCQMDNAKKIARADFIINTNRNYDLMVVDIKKVFKRIINEYS